MKPEEMVGPVVVHERGTIRYANEPFRSLIGADPTTDLAGGRLDDYVDSADREPLRAQFAQVAASDAPALGLEVHLQTPTGTREAVAVTSPVEWEGSTRHQTTFLTADRVAAESPILVLGRAMDEAPIGIAITDATREDEPLVYVNDGFVELTGYTREEALGRNCRFLQGEDTRSEPVAELRAAIEAGEPASVELRNYRKDGSMFWNRVTVSPVFDEQGGVEYVLGFQEDISAQKVHEREKALFKTHAEQADQAMIVANRRGEIEYVNPAFERITGYAADEIIGESPWVLVAGLRDDEFYEGIRKTITSGEVWEGQLTNRAKSGELYETNRRIVPVTDDRGEITHFASIERPITGERLTEQVISVLNRVLRHNLRTSINVIDGYASLLAEAAETSEQEASAQMIRDRTEALRDISEKTEYIRQIVRNYDDKRPQRLASVASVIEECREKHDAAEITYALEADPDLFVANGPVLQAALREAIENAVEHAESATPSVDVRVFETSDGDVRIDVADEGPGIPDEEWAIIEAGHETPLKHSRGVGLWLIYWSVTALGGEVSVADNEPRGSVLRFRIPVRRTADVADALGDE